LAALVYCLSNDLNRDFLVSVEGHGREDLFDGVDLSRSVGWFTSMYPVRFTPTSSCDEALREVKERLRSVPNHGVGYGVLRYMSQQASLNEPEPEIIFNFLGQFQTAEPGSVLRPIQDQGVLGGNAPVRGTRAHKLDIQAEIAAGRLSCSVMFSRSIHRRERIEAYAEQFQRALQHFLGHSAPVLSPSDFRAARIGTEDFQTLFQKLSKSAPR